MTRYIETANFYAEKEIGSTYWRSYRKDAEKKMVVGFANTIKDMRKSLARLEEKEAKLNANKETTVTLTAQELELLKKALSKAFFAMTEEEMDKNASAYQDVLNKLMNAFDNMK